MYHHHLCVHGQRQLTWGSLVLSLPPPSFVKDRLRMGMSVVAVCAFAAMTCPCASGGCTPQWSRFTVAPRKERRLPACSSDLTLPVKAHAPLSWSLTKWRSICALTVKGAGQSCRQDTRCRQNSPVSRGVDKTGKYWVNDVATHATDAQYLTEIGAKCV